MKAFVFDTETTGLPGSWLMALDRQPEIIELASVMVDLDTGEIEDEYQTLIKPGEYPMNDWVLKETKTKITNDMLKDAPVFADIAQEIRKRIEAAPLAIAHNLGFDRQMVDLEFERIGKPLTWPHCLCTVENTMHIKGFRLSLTNLHLELFGIAFADTHRAKTDLDALIRCACELFKRGLL